MRTARLLLLSLALGGCGAADSGTVAATALDCSAGSAPDCSVVLTDLSDAQLLETLASARSAGLAPTSLALYQLHARPIYALILRRATGTPWTVLTGQTADQLTAAHAQLSAQGYSPVAVSATSDRSGPHFAAIYRLDRRLSELALGLSEAQFDATYEQERAQGYVARGVASYGTAASPLLVGAWADQDPAAPPTIDDFDRSPTDADLLQQLAAGQAGQLHPQLLVPEVNGASEVVWHGDNLGQWTARTVTTSAQLSSAVALAAQSGLTPLSIAATDTGRFGVVFVHQLQPVARALTVTGAAVPELAALDDILTAELQRSGARAASLAVARQGKLVYARAFTWAEAGYPITQPTSLFRIASMTKAITATAIMQRVDAGQLTGATTMQSVLQLPLWSDVRWPMVTVDHLLSHTAGWDRRQTYDPMFYDQTIAAAFNLPLPVSKQEITRYMSTQLLSSDPGARFAYSNFGFALLGQMIEKQSGQSYAAYVQQNLLERLGITRARIASSTGPLPGEVGYDDPYLSRSVMVAAQPWVPLLLGGYNIEANDANGGWVMAAADYAKFLASFDPQVARPLLPASVAQTMWTPPFPAASTTYARGWIVGHDHAGRPFVGHDGLLESGTSTLGYRLSDDGVSVVAFFDDVQVATGSPGPLQDSLDDALANVATWPTGDAFPTLGLPSF